MTCDPISKEVESLLKNADIHQRWWNDYFRNPQNRAFYDQAFAYISSFLKAPSHSNMLDAGCGTCSHSIRLANHGFLVHAVDLSRPVLTTAKVNVSANQLNQQIGIYCANLRSLPFKDSTFQYALCWGVLMHIPDLDTTLSELCRVIKPAGTL